MLIIEDMMPIYRMRMPAVAGKPANLQELLAYIAGGYDCPEGWRLELLRGDFRGIEVVKSDTIALAETCTKYVMGIKAQFGRHECVRALLAESRPGGLLERVMGAGNLCIARCEETAYGIKLLCEPRLIVQPLVEVNEQGGVVHHLKLDEKFDVDYRLSLDQMLRGFSLEKPVAMSVLNHRYTFAIHAGCIQDENNL